jgi:hypothetical protein
LGCGAEPLRATLECDYLDKKLGGLSPKFACQQGDRELKVKYGGDNAEVYGEVLASRLLWALGFGADRLYSVRVICRGCPRAFGGIARENGDSVFDPAVIEWKMDAVEYPGPEGWSFEELALVNDEVGGAPRAHVDALKLLAVFMQHTDNKRVQQRLVCLDQREEPAEEATIPCARPFMLMHDVGLTFGRANTFNANKKAVNLSAWAATPVWKDAKACVGNLAKSFTGTLGDPAISEEGRAFLAGLLSQLSDRQLHDLFTAARVTLRLRDPLSARSGFPSTDEWVKVFKQKRAEIVDHRCA